jgi:chromosome segregation ATPase
MARRRTEPVKNTCPDIDRLKDTLRGIITAMASCTENNTSEHLISLIESWSSELDDIGVGSRCELETLRESNAALREWGQEMYDEAETLEKEKDKLEEEKDKLQEEITSLEDEASSLEDLIEELKQKLTC